MAVLVDIINTGNELLLGRTLNRHGAYFGGHLVREGLQVRRQVTVPDGGQIADELQRSLEESDVILVTGGLGPTSDDLTRDITASLLGLELHRDEAIVEAIRQRLHKRGRQVGDNQLRQAMVPEGAIVLANSLGTAPGLYLPPETLAGRRCKALFLLPGPPGELHPLFENQVLPTLRQQFASACLQLTRRELRFAGIGEGELARQVEGLLAGIDELEIGYCAHIGEVDLRLSGSELAVATALERVCHALSLCIVSENEGGTLEGGIIERLKQRRETLATVESCTGGSLAARLTDVAGCSEVFGWGAVTYANEAKTRLAGVDPALLETHGAVSDPVAKSMADGALAASGADHALATTGIAGPSGGSAEKPVGTVFIALASKGQPTLVEQHLIDRDRKAFKTHVTSIALDMLRRRLNTQ